MALSPAIYSQDFVYKLVKGDERKWHVMTLSSSRSHSPAVHQFLTLYYWTSLGEYVSLPHPVLQSASTHLQS